MDADLHKTDGSNDERTNPQQEKSLIQEARPMAKRRGCLQIATSHCDLEYWRMNAHKDRSRIFRFHRSYLKLKERRLYREQPSRPVQNKMRGKEHVMRKLVTLAGKSCYSLVSESDRYKELVGY